MIGTETAAMVCGLVGLVAVVSAVVALRVLPEPATDEPGSEDKPSYRALLQPWFLVMVGLWAVALTAVAAWRLDPTLWPAWLVLATIGTVLAMIDAATTWLPNVLMRLFWLAMALAAVTSAGLGGGWTVVARMAAGSVAWGLLFWLVWAVSRRQLGFGDVRLAFGLGAAAGAAGWVTIYTCLLAGTLVGAGWGLIHRLRSGRRPGPFPYGMALFLGCGLGLALTPA